MKQTPQLLEGRGQWFCQVCNAPGGVRLRHRHIHSKNRARHRAAACPPHGATTLSPTSACSQLTQASADTGTRGAGTTPGPMQCTRHLLYVGWKEKNESKAQDLEKDWLLLALPTGPASQECLPMFGLSHTGAARGKLDPGNTAYPSQDPSARCCLRQ